MNSIIASINKLLKNLTTNFRGDILGGFTSSLMGVSASMAYGMIAFSPLGPSYIKIGIISGLIGFAFANIGTSIFSGNPVMIIGPDPLASVMLASALAILLKNIVGVQESEIEVTAIIFLFFIIFMSGLLQILLGVLKLGNIAKYIPYPVMAGLLNGVAILLIVSQIKPMFGLSSGVSLTDLKSIINEFQILTFVIGVLTVLSIKYSRKFIKRILPLFVGIFVGTSLYYISSLIGLEEYLGKVVGDIPKTVPKPFYFEKLWGLFNSTKISDNIILLGSLIGGLTFAISLKTLIVSVATDNITKLRSDTNRELVGEGIGNILSSIFGGLASTGSQARSIVNYQSGGRTNLAKLVSGILVIVVLVWLSPLISLLPKVVLAAILVSVSFSMVDSWSLGVISQFSFKSGNRRYFFADITIVITVMVIMVVFGIFASIFAGILLSIGIFIYRMSGKTIRNEYTAKTIRSSVDRVEKEIILLEKNGHRIHVYELEGSIFFGTADQFASLIDPEINKNTKYVIVDFKRVSDIDSTGVNILVQLKNKYDRLGKFLVLSGIEQQRSYNRFFAVSGAEDAIGKYNFFSDIDDALAWAEDKLLDNLIAPNRYKNEIELIETELVGQFSSEEVNILNQYCVKEFYKMGNIIFKQKNPADSLMIILKGRVDIYIFFEDQFKSNRISTIRPGTILGEIAVLDKKPRSATAIAKEDVTVAKLSILKLMELQKENPDIYAKFLIGVGRELAKRIRIMDAFIAELRV